MPSINNVNVTSTQYTGAELTFSPASQLVTVTVTNGGLYAKFAPKPDNQQFSRGGAYAYLADEKYMLPGVYGWGPSDFQGYPIAAITWRAADATQPVVLSITG